MAILTTSGRTALAIAVAAQPIHLAWGTGSAAWDSTPIAEPITATALVAELGRRAPTTQSYVSPDVNGSIIVPTGSYSVSGAPTNNLYLNFAFDYTDAPTASIRELGVFVGTVLAGGLPVGEVYFEPDDVATPGTLLALQYVPVITRSANTRQTFEFVLTL